jgi:very-short-patch-repair endonuclease
MIRDGIPVTNPARTLLDLAGQVGADELAEAINEAHVHRLVSQATLLHLIPKNRGRPGIRSLRSICADGRRMTRSAAERRFLSLLRRTQLPLPQTNAKLGGYEVDFLWPDEGLVVETDGWAAHSSRAAFERDRKRDAELAGLGISVIRVTWRQLSEEPAATARLIRKALAARVAEPS